MSNKKSVVSGSGSGSGIGFGGLLFLLFLGLKLGEVGQVADWSWWWVTSPLWIPLGIVVGLTALGLAAIGTWLLIATLSARRKRKRFERKMRAGNRRNI